LPRGIPHSPELRAQVVAAVLAGMSIAQAAAQFKVDKSLVSRWLATSEVATVATDQRARARDPEYLEGLIFDLVAEHITTLRAQLQAAAGAQWLEKQTAAELADLLGTERDSLIRLLAGFRPVAPAGDSAVVDQPRLGPAGASEAAGG
jgi:transposase